MWAGAPTRRQGLCHRRLQADPQRPILYAERLAQRLPAAPAWLGQFAARLAATRHASTAVGLLRELGSHLADGDIPPHLLLQRCRRATPSGGPLAKALEGFLADQRLVLRTEREEALASGRRRRLLDRVPEHLRAAVLDFADAQLTGRERARRTGVAMRSHDTIENNLSAARDLAVHLAARVAGWEQVTVGDVEAFLASRPALRARRLSSLRAHSSGTAVLGG